MESGEVIVTYSGHIKVNNTGTVTIQDGDPTIHEGGH